MKDWLLEFPILFPVCEPLRVSRVFIWTRDINVYVETDEEFWSESNVIVYGSIT